MKNNDDMLARQGDVYTLVDADGYVVREDINGERKRYALEGEGGGGGGISESRVNTIVDNKITDFKNNELNDIIDDKILSFKEDDLDSIIDDKIYSFTTNELSDIVDDKVNAKFEEYANKEW